VCSVKEGYIRNEYQDISGQMLLVEVSLKAANVGFAVGIDFGVALNCCCIVVVSVVFCCVIDSAADDGGGDYIT